MSDIFEDVRNSSASDIRRFIETEFDGDANFHNDNGFALLHFAAVYAGNVEVVKVLVSMGANVNARTNDGYTPLHGAKDVQIAKALISLGANVNAQANDGRPPLSTALFNKNIDVAKVLIDMGADLNMREENGLTPFNIAIINGEVEIVEACLSHGADVNRREENGSTPLHMAAVSNDTANGRNIEMAKLLVSKGADINARTRVNENGDSYTPLDVARNKKDTAMVQYLSGVIAEKEKAVEKAAIDQISANYKDALRNNPNDAKVYEERGCEFLSKGYLDQGIADFTQVIRLNPNNAEAYRFRGMAYSQQKKYDKAIADFNEAIRLKPNEYVDYMNRGVAYYETHLKDQARRDLEKVLSLNPDDDTTLSVAKQLLEEMNRAEQERIDRERREEQERIEKQRQEEEDARKAEIKRKIKKIAIAAVIAAICIVAGLIVFNSPKKSAAIPGSPVSTNQQSSPASSDNSQQSQNSFQATHKVVTNDGSNLRLRDAAGFSGSQIGSLEYGSSVRVLEIGESAVDSDGNRGNWTYVSTPDGKKGWCFGAYLQVLPQ